MPEGKDICTNCNASAGYSNGIWQCSNGDCSTIWWGPFDEPSGEGKGKWCYQCESHTLYEVAQISNVNVLRCHRCGATRLEIAR